MLCRLSLRSILPLVHQSLHSNFPTRSLRLLTSTAGSNGSGTSRSVERTHASNEKSTGGEVDTPSRQKNLDDDLLSEKNVRHLSPLEVARMKIVYQLVKEHAEVVEQRKPPLDPELNPMIDPRSFKIRTLPQVPNDALKQFREEVPATEAEKARLYPSRHVWDSLANPQEEQSEELSAVDPVTDNAWSAVDEQTMDPYFYQRMQRQKLGGRSHPASGAQTQLSSMSFGFGRNEFSLKLGKRRKPRCRLSDRRGRVSVDFREVGVLTSFLTEQGKIIGRKKTGLSAKAQRKVSRCVKTARQMALLHPEPKPGLTLEEMEAMEKELNAMSETI